MVDDTSPYNKDDFPSTYVQQMVGNLDQKRSLASIFKESPKEHVKLLQIMLSFDPKNRLSAKGLLENKIFNLIRNKKIEKGCP